LDQSDSIYEGTYDGQLGNKYWCK